MTKYHYTILSLALTIIFSPFFVMAQTASTSSEPEITQQNLEGWRNQSSGLQQKINALDSTPASPVFIPVLFGVALSNLKSTFGEPRSGGRTHEGIDIMSPKGTPIVSPTFAVVLSTGVWTGAGNYVTTANPGGETFVYMHLDRYGEGVVSGAVLEPGSLIGYVGNTGNASGGADHLHFEIHNSSGTVMDPFPRLTGEFSIEQKISFLNKIFTQTSNATSLAQLLVSNFRASFVEASSKGITLSPLITNFLSSIPVQTTNTTPILTSSVSNSGTLPAGDLELGSEGPEVVALQNFLIAKNLGPKAQYLGRSGATGYFGSVTKAALIEYQIAMGISATGYYGSATRASVQGNSVAGTNPSSGASAPSSGGNSFVLTRNLYLGVSGEDVRMLQKFLNSHGYTVAVSGLGSAGNETVYFGSATKSAVIRFQTANNISPAVGYVGAITRAFLATIAI